MQIEIKCQNIGAPECLENIDEKYTMSFEDIGEGFIYWCSACGPGAHAMDRALTSALHKSYLKEGDPFIDKLSDAITKAEAEVKAKQS